VPASKHLQPLGDKPDLFFPFFLVVAAVYCPSLLGNNTIAVVNNLQHKTPT